MTALRPTPLPRNRHRFASASENSTDALIDKWNELTMKYDPYVLADRTHVKIVNVRLFFHHRKPGHGEN